MANIATNFNMKSDRKYELVPDEASGLFRVRAVKDFGEIKKGTIGGLVESARNLRHQGNCWIEGDARVIEKGEVSDNGVVKDNSIVRGSAKVLENAVVFGNTIVEDEAVVMGAARLGGSSHIKDFVYVSGNGAVILDVFAEGDEMVKGAPLLVSPDYVPPGLIRYELK